MTPSILRMPPTAPLTSDQFYDLCRANPDWKLERTAQGDLVVMAPTGGETGARNASLLIKLGMWNERVGRGVLFDSLTGFHLPHGANRSPDIAWVEQSRWDALTPQQREKFPPLAPDFAIEIMSPSDRLTDAQAKMQEYLENGVRLGWLFNRADAQVEVYQEGKAVVFLERPRALIGEPILPGFELELDKFW